VTGKKDYKSDELMVSYFNYTYNIISLTGIFYYQNKAYCLIAQCLCLVLMLVEDLGYMLFI